MVPLASNEGQSSKGIIYRWIFFMGPLWIMVLSVTLLMGMLTVSVMKEERTIISKRNESIQSSNINRLEQNDDFFDNNVRDEHDDSSPSDVRATSNINDIHRLNESDNDGISKCSADNDTKRKISNNHLISILYREESFELERTKRLFRQALLYVGVFYITWVVPSITSLIKISSQKTVEPPFFVLVLICLLEPMQGFWNCIGERVRDVICFLGEVMNSYSFSSLYTSLSVLPYDGLMDNSCETCFSPPKPSWILCMDEVSTDARQSPIHGSWVNF